MEDFSASLRLALALIAGADARLYGIVALSLAVSLGATVIACVVGMPAGAWLAVGRFTGRRALIVLFNGLMGLPPVVVGLLVYLLLSRAGLDLKRGDYELVGAGAPAPRLESMKKGETFAAILNPPVDVQATQAGMVRLTEEKYPGAVWALNR